MHAHDPTRTYDGIWSCVSDGTVTLFGVTRDRGAPRDIEQTITANFADAMIRNDIKVTGPLLNA